MPRHIIMKLLNIKNKENLKSRKKKETIYKGIASRLSDRNSRCQEMTSQAELVSTKKIKLQSKNKFVLFFSCAWRKRASHSAEGKNKAIISLEKQGGRSTERTVYILNDFPGLGSIPYKIYLCLASIKESINCQ